MKELVNIMRKMTKFLLLKGSAPTDSVLSRKIKISGKQEKKYKKGSSSVLSMKVN